MQLPGESGRTRPTSLVAGAGKRATLVADLLLAVVHCRCCVLLTTDVRR